MNFFDLHCDTLYRLYEEDKGIYKNDFHISIERSKNIDKYIGCFAVWMPDEFRGTQAIDFFNRVYKKFQDEKLKSSKHIKQIYNSKDMDFLNLNQIGMIFTVEGGSVLGGKIEQIKYLYECGVKVITLTWNGTNEIGAGAFDQKSGGITEFGIKAVKEMEKLGIIIDISHASRKLFYDVSKIATKPFIATHSNSYSVCKHDRNLTDEQFKIIKENGGIVGITFCPAFLKEDSDANIDDIMKHIEHFLSMNGEKVLSIGSDFDGTDMPNGIIGIQSIEILYEYLLKHNYRETLVNDILYNNAYSFFRKII